MRLLLSTILLLCFLARPVMAEEYVYSPEGCDFEMTFPSEPSTTRRCHDLMPDKCELKTTFTKVFDMDASMTFYVSCKPATDDFRKDYTVDLMRTTLLAQPYVSTLEAYNTSFDDSDGIMIGSLLGAGKSPNGKDIMLYVTQLWVGPHSVLSLEGELIGEAKKDSDKIFADILHSMHSKVSAKPLEDATAKDDAADQDKKAPPKADDAPAAQKEQKSEVPDAKDKAK